YYQQQQSPYDRNAPPGYTQQQPQSKSSFQRVEQRLEREHPQVPQSPKRVEFSPQATVLEERRVGFPDQSQTVRMEKQVHQQIIQQEREHV
ncbi:hypothetical protein, partial [Staphylococcus aureus]|uniref:hypothetical protein n=1 Tax=Staphylococcus aureus TaxID=1280 RepID=UPI0038B3A2C5